MFSRWKLRVRVVSTKARRDISCRAQVRSSIGSNLSSGNKHLCYARGWAWQNFILSQRLTRRRKGINNDEDVIIMLEHDHVYTLGRGASEDHLPFLRNQESVALREKISRRNYGKESATLSMDRAFNVQENTSEIEAINRLSSLTRPVLAPNGVPIYRVERGGEVTYHGPGQLVVYPMIDLTRQPYQKDLHWFLRQTEEVVIHTLREFGIEGKTDSVNTGVWVGDDKICAIGVSASRWITTHGFALNVHPNLDFFDTSVIIPCGIEGKGVTSIAKVLSDRGETELPPIEAISKAVLTSLQKVLGAVSYEGQRLV